MITPAVDVLGLAVWSADAPATPATQAPARATGRPRRRSSLLTQMVAEVAAQATVQAGVPLDRVRLVVGSAFGELGITVEMLAELVDSGQLSPTRFHNSVHNSAAGALSIAHGNTAAAMSLAAGNDTVAMALLEAMMIARAGGDPVLLIVADEPLPAALTARPGTTPLAAALVLAAPGASREQTSTPAAAPPLARLCELTAPAATAAPTAAAPDAFRPVEVDVPCAAVLPLAAAIRGGQDTRVLLAPPGMPGWSVTVKAGPQPP